MFTSASRYAALATGGLLALTVLPAAGASAAPEKTPIQPPAACDQSQLQSQLNSGGKFTFGADCNLVITTTLTVAKHSTLTAGAHSVVLDGGATTRVLHVEAGGHLKLVGLTIRNGQVDPPAPAAGADGAAGTNGAVGTDPTVGGDGKDGPTGVTAAGAGILIDKKASAVLVNDTVSNNSVTGSDAGGGGTGGVGGTGGDSGSNGGGSSSGANGGMGGAGGAGGLAIGAGVYNAGTLTVIQGTFSHNNAYAGNGGDGGIGGDGGNGGNVSCTTGPPCPTTGTNTGNNGGTAGHGGIGGAGGNAAGAAIGSVGILTIDGTEFASNAAFGGQSGSGGRGGNGGNAGCNVTVLSCGKAGAGGNGGNGGNGGSTAAGAVANLGKTTPLINNPTYSSNVTSVATVGGTSCPKKHQGCGGAAGSGGDVGGAPGTVGTAGTNGTAGPGDSNAATTGVQPLKIHPKHLKQPVVGKSYKTKVTATGGIKPYVFSCVDVPKGLNCHHTGLITGTPKQHGKVTLKVTVTDPIAATPATKTKFYKLTVAKAPKHK